MRPNPFRHTYSADDPPGSVRWTPTLVVALGLAALPAAGMLAVAFPVLALLVVAAAFTTWSVTRLLARHLEREVQDSDVTGHVCLPYTDVCVEARLLREA
ncbi:MAG: hypothetical protein ABEI31_07065 [Halodesulfurarchaeum sp.]